MNLLRNLTLIAHLLGMAAILGGFFEQLRASTKRITKPMLWGARAQIVTGLLLVGLIYANDGEPDNAKIGTKLVIALAIAGLSEASAKKAGSVRTQWLVVGVLTVVNVFVAVLWR